ncbi:hypothetical protein ACFVXQ_00185 [Kitasatospora sp. NPDC058263]
MPGAPTAEQLAELPEWARTRMDGLAAELTRAQETATTRSTELADLAAKLAAAPDPAAAQVAAQEAATKIAAAEAQLTRERLARQYGLPDALVGRITGADPAAMENDAKTLAALLPPAGPRMPSPDPLQGGGTPAPNTPEATFAALITEALGK